MDHNNDVVMRSLDGNEHGLFRISNERHGSCRVACCARLYGVPFTNDVLQSAVDKIQRRHPLLNSVVHDDMRFHSNDKARIKVTCHQRANSRSWQDVLDEEVYSEGLRFDEPLMKVAVVANDDVSEQEFELLLSVEHVVSDGISISSLLDEVLTLTTQPSLNMEPLRVPPSIETCASKQPWTFETWILFLHFMIFVLKPLLRLISWCMKPVSEQSLRHRRFAVRTLTALQTQLLVESARHERTSVTGALVATVMAATRMAQNGIGANPSSVSCICPIDLRSRYINEPVNASEVAYHVGVVQLSDKVALPVANDASSISAEDLWQLARSTRSSLIDKARNEVFAMAKLAGSGATAISARIKNAATAAHSGFMSNWGKTPLKQIYGKWRLLEMIPLLRLQATNIRECLAASTNGQLTLSFNVPDVACSNPETEVETFADSVVNNLDRMMSASMDKAESKKQK